MRKNLRGVGVKRGEKLKLYLKGVSGVHRPWSNPRFGWFLGPRVPILARVRSQSLKPRRRQDKHKVPYLPMGTLAIPKVYPPDSRAKGSWRGRSLFTRKQKPLLDQFFLHAPWCASRYSVRREEDRVTSLVRALGMYYGIKEEKFFVRPIRNRKHKVSRALSLYKHFAGRLSMLLARDNWFGDPVQARAFLDKSNVVYQSPCMGQQFSEDDLDYYTKKANPDTVLESGDTLRFSEEVIRHLRIRWYRQVRLTRRTKHVVLFVRRYRRVDSKKRRYWRRRRRSGTLFRLYKQYTARLATHQLSQLKYLPSKEFIVSFASMHAVYRPSRFYPTTLYKGDTAQGTTLDFWADTLNLKKI